MGGGGGGVSNANTSSTNGCGGGVNVFKKTTNEEGNLSTPPATKPRQRMRTSSMPVENRKVSLFALFHIYENFILFLRIYIV